MPPALSLNTNVLLVGLIVASLPNVTTPLVVVAVICPPFDTLKIPLLVIVTEPVPATPIPVPEIILVTPALVNVMVLPRLTVPPPLNPEPAVTVTLLLDSLALAILPLSNVLVRSALTTETGPVFDDPLPNVIDVTPDTGGI